MYNIANGLPHIHEPIYTSSLHRAQTYHTKRLLVSEECRDTDQRLRPRAQIPPGCCVFLHWTQTHVLYSLLTRALHDYRHVDPRELLYSSGEWWAYRTMCHHSAGRKRVPAGSNRTAARAVRHTAVDWCLLHRDHVWNWNGAGRYCSCTDGSSRHVRAAEVFDLFNRLVLFLDLKK